MFPSTLDCVFTHTEAHAKLGYARRDNELDIRNILYTKHKAPMLYSSNEYS